MMHIKIYLVAILMVLYINLHGQQSSNWKKSEANKLEFELENASFWSSNYLALYNEFEIAPKEDFKQNHQLGKLILLPILNELIPFYVLEYEMMEKELMNKFPNFKTYKAIAKNNKLWKAQIDFTEFGFHAIIRTPEETYFIDPVSQVNNEKYISYSKSDYKKNNKKDYSEKEPLLNLENQPNQLKQTIVQVGEQLRTYRLAVSATGEYSAFYGGTVSGAMSGIVTTINRVNGVYENDLSVRLVLVANNNLLVYTNSATDPFSNFNSGALLTQNQTTIDNTIGTANYDVGHVFSTGGGGLAMLGVPCTSSKAMGVTGSTAPIGDPYDIDYVAHELGHQFGANHTFNGSGGACGGNRNASTAFEPGSGSSIMAYAGICGSDNIQNNSDDHFHAGSLQEIINFTQFGAGNNCPIITNTSNTTPSVSTPSGGFYIPISTAFELLGDGNDVDGDTITFNWEQFDLGPSGAPNTPSGNAPLFRSFPSKTTPLRIFPKIQDIVNNVQVKGEILPDYTRAMNFILTVRDNNFGAGGHSQDVISFNTTANAGPFKVVNPNSNMMWYNNSYQLVEWDVANTNTSPVNCNFVDILLSTDGGFTYSDTLAKQVVNGGSAIINVPDSINTTTARVKVKASNSIFFDISNQNFSIQQASIPTITILASDTSEIICTPDSASYTVYFSALSGFSDTIDLTITGVPPTANVQFSKQTFLAPEIVTFKITNTNLVSSGNYILTLTASSNGIPLLQQDFELIVSNGTPSIPSPFSPIDNSLNVSTSPLVQWMAIPGALGYDLEIATDSLFSNIVSFTTAQMDTFFTPLTLLNSNTDYYWRVFGLSDCGVGAPSVVYHFTTGNLTCYNYIGTDIFKVLSSSSSPLNSIIYVPINGIVGDVNIKKWKGNHQNVSDIKATLIAPSGKEVLLLKNECDGTANYDIKFDDQASNSIICPLNNGFNVSPEQPLSLLNGENSKGNWTLKMEDNVVVSGGIFQAFDLEVCTVDGLVGLQDINENGFICYPNPFLNEINIQNLYENKSINVKIVNVLGQTIVNKNYENTSVIKINTENYEKGMYAVILFSDKNTLLGKFNLIKQ